MALALYRKYRPRTFAEVIGQEHVTEPLSVALRTGRLHHAYLFSGPRGCGKTSSARILARSLNCAEGPTPDPCGVCQSCRDLAPDGPGSIDVIEIDAASHGGVDDARDLRERAFFAPVASQFKVYVIDEAHMVSSAGFNALLKLVEEPPEYVKFVFATTEPEKVLGTIKSRTHHYPFRLIPPGVLRPYLEKLSTEEGVAVEPAVFPLVVRAGGGSARDSLSVLDQLIAGAGPDGVTYARAVALLGVTDAALIDDVCDALAVGDGAAVYAAVDRVAEAGHDPRRFASDLLERLRDLIVLQQVPDAAAKGLIDAPADQLDRMGAQAAQIGPATLSRFADIVHNGLTEMRGTTAPRLLLELICARMLLPGAEESAGALLQRLERMERRLGASTPEAQPPAVQPPAAQSPAVQPPAVQAPAAAAPGPPAPAPPPAPSQPPPAPPQPSAATPASAPAPPRAAAPEPARSPEGPPGALDAVAVRRMWPEIVATLKNRSKKDAALVHDAVVSEIEGATLVVRFKHQAHARMVTNAPDALTGAITHVLGGSWTLRCEVAGDATPTHATPTPAVDRPAPVPAVAPAPRVAPAARTDDDWPTPARPGGRAAAATVPSRSAAPARKAAKSQPPADEPPYDPEYDPPVRDPQHVGFDPGDEPLDDVDEAVVRQSSEEQALRLLAETLGAEKIE